MNKVYSFFGVSCYVSDVSDTLKSILIPACSYVKTFCGPFLVLILLVMQQKKFITLYSNSLRYYSGALVSGSLCLLIKITQSNEVQCFYTLLVNLVSTVALARHLIGLLHSNITEKSNKTIKPATVFQNSTKKPQRLQNYVSSVVFCYITDFFYDEYTEIHHHLFFNH